MAQFKILTIFLLWISLLSSPVLAANAPATLFVFSTPPQHISAGAISGKINIQSQTPVGDTTYITLTSTSPTGQFVLSSGALLKSVYIAKGDSNRAVYYTDSSAGDFVLTAKISDKDKTQITEIHQHIIVGTSNSGATLATTTATQTVIYTDNIGEKIDKATQALQVISAELKGEDKAKETNISHVSSVPKIEKTIATSTESTENSLSSSTTSVVFEAKESRGFVSTLFEWPIRFFNFVIDLF